MAFFVVRVVLRNGDGRPAAAGVHRVCELQERYEPTTIYAAAKTAGTQKALGKEWVNYQIENIDKYAKLPASLELSPEDRSALEAYGRWETGVWMTGARIVDAITTD